MSVTHGIGEVLNAEPLLTPQTVAAGGPTDSAVIDNPAKKGELLGLIVQGGDLTGVTANEIKVMGSEDGTTYEAVADNAGNDLVFTASKTIAGGALENGVLFGTVPVHRLKYNHYKLQITPTGAGAPMAAAAVIMPLHAVPSDQDDDLYERILPA